MVFYKGAITYHELKKMPIPEIDKLLKYATKINEEQEKAMKKYGKF